MELETCCLAFNKAACYEFLRFTCRWRSRWNGFEVGDKRKVFLAIFIELIQSASCSFTTLTFVSRLLIKHRRWTFHWKPLERTSNVASSNRFLFEKFVSSISSTFVLNLTAPYMKFIAFRCHRNLSFLRRFIIAQVNSLQDVSHIINTLGMIPTHRLMKGKIKTKESRSPFVFPAD